MRVIGIYNIKGGVGKTATAVNLAYLAAKFGWKTLLWDLDPQGATSFYFRIKPKIKGGTKKILQKKRSLEEHIKGTDYENLDLLPADFSYRNMDLMLGKYKQTTQRLLKLIKPLANEYDILFFDCPPSISLVSENIFSASDMLLVPTIPTTLSQLTYKQLLDFFRNNRLDASKLKPFFSMVDRRKRMHLEILRDLPRKHPEFLSNHIPYASDVERMGIHRKPLADCPGKSLTIGAYNRLWQEISPVV